MNLKQIKYVRKIICRESLLAILYISFVKDILMLF